MYNEAVRGIEMTFMKRWIVEERTPLPDELVDRLNITPLVRKVVEARHLSEQQVESLLTEQQLHDPYLIHDMDKAVNRIKQAVAASEPILVYGDYDADGVTSVTILMSALSEMGALCDFYIPNRFTEGYGPNENVFRYAADEGVKLIITVDNGVKGHHEVDVANSLGVDVIITDHHEIGETLPAAFAVIHPAHPEGQYPAPNLAGAGVSYKLSEALLDRQPTELLSYAAIGTVSDLVPLIGENRTIVKAGLRQLNQHLPVGLHSLLQHAGHSGDITEETIGFIIGPRLNAVGRLDDARPAVELLMTEEKDEAEFLSEQVEAYNIERKEIVAAIAEEALKVAEDKVSRGLKFLVIAGEDWNEGVLGIVASRIINVHHLPVIVLNLNHEEGYAKGSARSIEGISMYEFLDRHVELLSKFGGHTMAAGLTMPIHHVDELEMKLNEDLEQMDFDFTPVVHIDAEVDISDITVDHIYQLEQLRPFGTSNPKPLFKVSDAQLTQVKTMGQNDAHLKLQVDDELNALKWSSGELKHQFPVGTHVQLCGYLQLNEWNGNVSPQMIVEDMKTDELRIVDYRNQHARNFAFLKDEDVIYLINPSQNKPADNYYFYGEPIQGHDKIVLRDLPYRMELLEESLQSATASQIYVIFHTKKQLYFEGMPNLDKFRMLYKLILNRPVNLVRDGVHMTELLSVTPDTLMFMMKVLVELDVIHFESDEYHLNRGIGKVAFENSKVYQARQHMLQQEQALLFSPFDEIKEMIKTSFQ